ncbi:MAG: cupin domain-containing protein [Chloroflexi bacterium]|nr:cupin domain-containing protein [Chloroflexota bacterium]
MPLEVFDYRRDIKNVVITPEVRARFLRFEPGDVATRHSHDLGAEVFLIMQGRAEFEIEGETAVLGPGELCFAGRDEMHQVRVVGDEPVIMYLSVTPHVEPTHTMYAEDGSRLPPKYGHATSEERAEHDPSAGISTADLALEHFRASRELARLARETAARHAARTAEIEQLSTTGDDAGAKAIVDAMWPDTYATLSAVARVEVAWNELAARVDSG